jgi:hypothetical protein
MPEISTGHQQIIIFKIIMKTLNLNQIFLRTPVNRNAFLATSQKNCVEVEKDLNFTELTDILNRLNRKNRLLKTLLKIKTKTQHKNLKNKFKQGLIKFRSESNKSLIYEYFSVGQQIENIHLRLKDFRDCKRDFYNLTN